jgi:hypothetical protein
LGTMYPESITRMRFQYLDDSTSPVRIASDFVYDWGNDPYAGDPRAVAIAAGPTGVTYFFNNWGGGCVTSGSGPLWNVFYPTIPYSQVNRWVVAIATTSIVYTRVLSSSGCSIFPDTYLSTSAYYSATDAAGAFYGTGLPKLELR